MKKKLFARAMPARRRSEILETPARLLGERKEEAAHHLAPETAKPIKAARRRGANQRYFDLSSESNALRRSEDERRRLRWREIRHRRIDGNEAGRMET